MGLINGEKQRKILLSSMLEHMSRYYAQLCCSTAVLFMFSTWGREDGDGGDEEGLGLAEEFRLLQSQPSMPRGCPISSNRSGASATWT